MRLAAISLPCVVICVGLYACRDVESAKTPGPRASSAGIDVTQAFMLRVDDLMVDVTAGSLQADWSLSIAAAEAPTEFLAHPEARVMSSAFEVIGKDGVGVNLAAFLNPISLRVGLTDKPAPDNIETEDIDEAQKDLCVLGKGPDGQMRIWRAKTLELNAEHKWVRINTSWPGFYQALECGAYFADVAATDIPATGAGKQIREEPFGCDMRAVEFEGHCEAYFGKEKINAEAKEDAMERCEGRGGISVPACPSEGISGYCAYGYGTEIESVYVYYTATLYSDRETVKEGCTSASEDQLASWLEPGAFEPTPVSEQTPISYDDAGEG